MKMWTRPTALALLAEEYASVSMGTLLHLYDEDNALAQAAGVKIPSRSAATPVKASLSASSSCAVPAGPSWGSSLRVAQWNVHNFVTNNGTRTTNHIYDELSQHDADVIVLNEFGTIHPLEHIRFLKRMQSQLGYKYYKVADIDYPTAILARFNEVDQVEEIRLDDLRSAVVMRLHVPTSASTISASGGEANCGISEQESSGDHHHRHVWVYATHLNHQEFQPGFRRDEMAALLDHVNSRVDVAKEDPILIVGDFNQQRPTDYLLEEWQHVEANKVARDLVSITDGVADLLASQRFDCVWDTVPKQARNWPANQPPPATHWSGTIIDYVYSRNLQNVGAYVSASGWSDHRLVVTDWQLETTMS